MPRATVPSPQRAHALTCVLTCALTCALAAVIALAGCSSDPAPATTASAGPKPTTGLVSNQRIAYSDGLHNENSDLASWNNRTWLVFRGGETSQVGTPKARLRCTPRSISATAGPLPPKSSCPTATSATLSSWSTAASSSSTPSRACPAATSATRAAWPGPCAARPATARPGRPPRPSTTKLGDFGASPATTASFGPPPTTTATYR